MFGNADSLHVLADVVFRLQWLMLGLDLPELHTSVSLNGRIVHTLLSLFTCMSGSACRDRKGHDFIMTS